MAAYVQDVISVYPSTQGQDLTTTLAEVVLLI
jgi:hypothetical protein